MRNKYTEKEIIEHLKNTSAVLIILILMVMATMVAILTFDADESTILATGSSILSLVVLVYWSLKNNKFIKELKDYFNNR